MHLLVILAAMLFAAATPYIVVTPDRDVEWTDSAASAPAAPDREGDDDALAAVDDEARDDAKED
ncbi:MAG TPA: hypothetical protein VG943_03070 [Caulobacterales bacterium]|nr:hypothetical protein [Caulobacterales bacterium]